MCDGFYLLIFGCLRGLLCFLYPANYSASAGTLLSRERGVLSSRLMDNRHISLCQCHLSARLKMAYEIKACLTGSAINAILDSRTAASASLFTLYTSPLSPTIPYTYFSRSFSPLWGDAMCVFNSTEET